MQNVHPKPGKRSPIGLTVFMMILIGVAAWIAQNWNSLDIDLTRPFL